MQKDNLEQTEEMKATLSLINSVARAHLGYGGVGGSDWQDVKEWTDKFSSAAKPEEEKGTPRWERASADYCPRCASLVDLHIILKDGKEVINKERCISCEWTA